MDLLFMIRERALILLVLLIIAALSSVLLIAMWKVRNQLPKKLAGTIVVLNMLIMIATFTGILFVLSFGYNS